MVRVIPYILNICL